MTFSMREKLNLETGEKIIRCISEKDSESLKNLFSEEAASTANLEKDIEKLFSYCDGKISDSKMRSTGTETEIAGKHNSTEYMTTFTFNLDDVPYLLYYKYTPKNTFDQKKEGVKSIQTVKESDDDRYFCYWEDMGAGILAPD